MITLNKEELKLVQKNLKTITIILQNHACSDISPEFREDLKKISDNHKLNFCTTCNSGLWNICAQVYAAYNKYITKENNNAKRSKTKPT